MENNTLAIKDKSHSRRNRRKAKLGRNERVLKAPRLPRKIELKYNRVIRRSVRETKRIIIQRYTQSGLKDFQQSLEELYKNIPEFEMAKVAANDMVFEVNEKQSQEFYKSAQQAVGVNFKKYVNEQGLDVVLESSINENVKAITDLQVSSQRRVAAIVSRALIEQTGKTVSLRKELTKAFFIDDNQAKFIARDQTQRFFNGLNKFRQERAGIKKYMWITSKDQKVRESHKRNSRLIFSWSKPPVETGHPGHDYNCRCSASPILEL